MPPSFSCQKFCPPVNLKVNATVVPSKRLSPMTPGVVVFTPVAPKVSEKVWPALNPPVNGRVALEVSLAFGEKMPNDGLLPSPVRPMKRPPPPLVVNDHAPKPNPPLEPSAQ